MFCLLSQYLVWYFYFFVSRQEVKNGVGVMACCRVFISCMFFILFLATGSVFGQGIRFGIHIDPAITWLSSDVSDVSSGRAQAGFDFGLFADYYFAQNYAFATGVSLFNTGGELKYDKGISLHTKDGNKIIDPGGTVKYKIQYVKIPVALKFKTIEIGRFTYSANLGLDPMIRVSTRVNFRDVKDVHANQETKLFNFGWHFGLGGQYSLGGETAIFAGLFFMNTFTDITKPAHDKITSNNLLFRMGIVF